MSLSTTQYGYIVDPMVPFTDDKGKTIKNGFIRVFMAGTSTPVLTYRNYDGATNQEKIELDNSGRVKHNVIGSKGSLYKVVVYDAHHSQETPILTVDEIAVLGASINASGATIVTGLDSVTVQEENFLKATVDGTGIELALDPTEVTSEVSTISDAATAAPDVVVPLLDKTGTGYSKKISLANLFKFALDWISRLATTISSFASGDVFVVSNPTDGSRKMAASTLLELTAQNAIAEVSKATLLHGYVETSGNIPGNFVASEFYRTATLYGIPGTVVLVQGEGASGARLWATIDKHGYVLRRSGANVNSLSSATAVTLQGEEVGVIFNSVYVDNPNYRGKVKSYYSENSSIADTESALKKDENAILEEVESQSDLPIDEGYRLTNGTKVGSLVSSSSYKSSVVYGHVGDSFSVRGIGTNNARLWATFDKNEVIIRRAEADADTRSSAVDVTLQYGEVGIVFNTSFVANPANINNGIKLTKSVNDMLQDTIKASFFTYDGVHEIAKLPDGFVGECAFPYASKFNIRAKFVIKDNPYLFATSAMYFARLKRGAIVDSVAIKANTLTQVTQTFNDGGVTKTSYMPWTTNGVQIANSTAYQTTDKFLGKIAFGLRYVGEESTASVTNDGTKLTLKKGATTTDYPFSTYTTMGALFNAIAADTDFELSYNILEDCVPSDLAFFNEVQLVSEYKKNLGNGDEVFTDNPAFYLRYGSSGKVHQLEVFCDGTTIYWCVDGVIRKQDLSIFNQDGDFKFIVYDPDGHLHFSDIEICSGSVRDAECVMYRGSNEKIISSVNPCILIYEGHGIYDAPSVNSADSPEGGLDTTPDRLQKVFGLLSAKGYQSVPIRDVIGYLDGQNELPKRCFTLMFDDYRFNDVLDIKKRKAFTANGVFANLAVISSYDDTIAIDGQTVTIKDAVAICRNAGVECWSHTRNHRNMTRFKYSEYISETSSDVYDADLKGVNGNIIVYPGGNYDRYLIETLEFMGLLGAVSIASDQPNTLYRSKYLIVRVEIGMRETMDDIKSSIV